MIKKINKNEIMILLLFVRRPIVGGGLSRGQAHLRGGDRAQRRTGGQNTVARHPRHHLPPQVRSYHCHQERTGQRTRFLSRTFEHER